MNPPPAESHDQFRHRLTEHVLATLPPAESEAIEAHARDCRECRDHLSFLRLLRERLAEHGQELMGSHPLAESLVAYATEQDTLELDDLQAVGLHVQTCPICADVAESTRRVERAHSHRPGRRVSRRWAWSGAGAIAAVAAVVMIALLPISETPEPEQPTLLALPTSTRGETATQPVPRGTPLLLRVPVDPWNTRQSPDDFTLVATITDRDGNTVWREEISAERGFDPSTGAVHVLVPIPLEHPGALRFTLRDGTTVLYQHDLQSVTR